MDPVTKTIIAAALVATQYAIMASQKFEGPRLSELSVTGADYGTVIPRVWGTRRVECTIFFSEDLKEVKRRRKTKGGKFNEYTYFGTWAVAMCDNEVAGVTKIWFDKHLVYDNTGAGPQYPFTFTEKLRDQKRIQNSIRIYTGTDTQLPDPRMEASVNALFGADSCPAYRGLAYIMFEEIPLEKFGNRIPMVTVEVTTGTDAVYPFSRIPGTERSTVPVRINDMWGAYLDKSGETFFAVTFDRWIRVDLVTQRILEFGSLPVDIGLPKTSGIQSNGDLWLVDPITDDLYHFFAPSYQFFEIVDLPTVYGGSVQVFEIYGQVLVAPWSASPANRLTLYHAGFNMFVYDEPVAWTPSYFCQRKEEIWAFGAKSSIVTNKLQMWCIAGVSNGLEIEITLPVNIAFASIVNMGVIYYEADDTFIIAIQNTYLSLTGIFIKVTPSGTITHTYAPLEMDVFGITAQMTNWRGGDTLWTGYETAEMVEIRLADLTEVRRFFWNVWSAQARDALTNGLYIPSVNAWLSQSFSTNSQYVLRFIDRVSSEGTTLQRICEDIADEVNAGTDSDFTAFTQEIKGFSTTQGPAKNILEPLIALHDADIRPHNFGIQGVLRGSSAGTSVPTSRFVVSGSRYVVERASETDLPQRVDVTFADVGNDQQPNTATAIRRQADSQRTANVNADNYAEDVDTMRQLVERYIRRRWYEQESYEFAVPRTYIAFEPADVIQIQLDDLDRVGRIERMEIGANGVLNLKVVRDAPSIALLSGATGASADGQTPDTIYVAPPSALVLADIPLVVDADDTTMPFLYFGLAPLGGGSWPGADIWQSDTNVPENFSPGWAAATSEQRATIGFCSGEFKDGIPEVFDYRNKLQVFLWNGSLTSVTKEELLEDGTLNLISVGSELVQFQTAALQTNGSYLLSGFIRGRRGTEASCTGHIPGEYVMLIDDAVLKRSMGAGELGQTDYYRGVTSGRSFDSVATRSVLFTGAANKPYSPAHVELVRNSVSEDWSISWIRRSRIAQTNFVGSDLPLGETTEAYEVDVIDLYGDVVRTISSTSPSVTYTQAQQITDFGAAQTSLEVRVYQISTAVGRGFPTQQAA